MHNLHSIDSPSGGTPPTTARTRWRPVWRSLPESLVAASVLLVWSLVPLYAEPQGSSIAPETAAEQVQAYYGRLNARDFPAAWELLSPSFRTHLRYAEWVAGFDATLAISVASVAVTDQRADQETIALRVKATDRTPAGVEERSYGGTWIVIRTPSGWQLDRADLKQLS